MESHTQVTLNSYIVPLYYFTSTTTNVVTILDQFLVGSHAILPHHLANSTMVPQPMHVFVGNVVITQPPIGTPLPLSSNPSLHPLYNTLNTSISNAAQNPSEGSNIFVPPRYNVVSSFVPTPTQVLSRGVSIPPPSPRGYNHPSPSSSNQIGDTSHFVTSSFQIPIGGQPQVGGQRQVGGESQVGGHNPIYCQNILGLHSQPWNFPFQGNQQPPGGNLLNLILLYPLISGNHIQVL
jgi:hypothetical protein